MPQHVLSLPITHHVKLHTHNDLRREIARIYRLSLNGQLATDELCRLIFALRELRCTLEGAERVKTQREEGALNITPSSADRTVVIHVIPSGFYKDADGELRPFEQQQLAPPDPPDPFEQQQLAPPDPPDGDPVPVEPPQSEPILPAVAAYRAQLRIVGSEDGSAS